MGDSQPDGSGQSVQQINLDDGSARGIQVPLQHPSFFPENCPPPYATLYNPHQFPSEHLQHTQHTINSNQSSTIYPPPIPHNSYPLQSSAHNFFPILPQETLEITREESDHPGEDFQMRSHSLSPMSGVGCILNGEDFVDSDKCDFLRSRHDKDPLNVKFTNKTNEKIELYWIDARGKFQKLTKIRCGQSKDIDTFVSHVFLAETKKGYPLILNGNLSYVVERETEDQKCVMVAIAYAPKKEFLQSSVCGDQIQLRFSNRTHKHVTLFLHDIRGHANCVKIIQPKRAWLCFALSGYYFTVAECSNAQENLVLNYGWFYFVNPGKVGCIRKVLITEPMRKDSSSSSSD